MNAILSRFAQYQPMKTLDPVEAERESAAISASRSPAALPLSEVRSQKSISRLAQLMSLISCAIA